MNQHDDIDDARAALIDRRIAQTFDFLGDWIDDPHLLEVIPDDSTLAFRDVAIRRYRFRLTAYRPSGSGEHWTARVTCYAKASPRDGAEATTAEIRTHPPHGMRLPQSRSGMTAAEALGALEAELRDQVITPM